MIRIRQVKVLVQEQIDLKSAISKKLNINTVDIIDYKIHRTNVVIFN